MNFSVSKTKKKKENFEIRSNKEHYNNVHLIIKNKLKLIDEDLRIIKDTLYASQNESVIDDFADLISEFRNEIINKKLKQEEDLIIQSPSTKVSF